MVGLSYRRYEGTHCLVITGSVETQTGGYKWRAETEDGLSTAGRFTIVQEPGTFVCAAMWPDEGICSPAVKPSQEVTSASNRFLSESI